MNTHAQLLAGVHSGSQNGSLKFFNPSTMALGSPNMLIPDGRLDRALDFGDDPVHRTEKGIAANGMNRSLDWRNSASASL
jgi:hypothetical protein